MLHAKLEEDIFFGFSTPAPKSHHTRGLRPWIWKGRAWFLVVAVRITRRRSIGFPLPGDQRLVTLMQIVEYRDRMGAMKKGNLFIRGCTDSRLLPLLTRPSSWYLRHGAVRLQPGEVWADGFQARTLPAPVPAESMTTVLKDDHSGLLRVAGMNFYSALEKSHWTMRPLTVTDWQCDWLEGQEATLDFAFDSSESQAHWPWWRMANPL